MHIAATLFLFSPFLELETTENIVAFLLLFTFCYDAVVGVIIADIVS